MRNLLTTCAAIAVTALIALPAPAGAASSKASGVTQTQTAPTDISAARRHYRGYRGHYRGYRTYGYRYALDFMPFVLALVAIGARRRFGGLEKGLIVLSVAFVAYGIVWAVFE